MHICCYFRPSVHNYETNCFSRFHYCFISLCIVGIGSWLFHMTLYYEMQLLDELPMIWTSFLYLYCMLHTKSPKNSLNAKHGIGFLSICVAFTVLYISWKNILFFQVRILRKNMKLQYSTARISNQFQVFFLVLVLIIAVLDVHLMRTQYDEKSVKLFCLGIFLYALGGVVWLTDVHLCDQLRSLRANVIPTFISPFTQMHGWWHILAGYGTYMHLLFCIFQRETFLKRKPEFVFKFPVGLSLGLKKKQP